MRIISGKLKGKKLKDPIDKETRPLKDMVKESIFNIINHSNKFNLDLEKSNILDLFSGVGSFGIECLSRGVKKVIFVENYNKVLDVLDYNLKSLKLENYKILKKNIFEQNTFENFNYKFDIIFLDPPYKEKNINNLFLTIFENKLLNKNGIIILHRKKSDNDMLPKEFIKIEEKTYGISKIMFFSTLN